MLILIDKDWDYVNEEIKLKAEQVNALYNQKDKDYIYEEEKFNFFILSINYTLCIINPIKSKKPKEVLDKLKPFAEAHINSLLDELIFILEQTPYKEIPIIEKIPAILDAEKMKMTIDEAIAHCNEVAVGALCEGAVNHKTCGEEHKQLGEWLKELQGLKEKTTANVTKPNHYKGKNLECVQAIDEILLMNNSQGVSAYYLSNIVKYIWRYKNKNGIQDLQKAKKCIELLIEEEQKIK